MANATGWMPFASQPAPWQLTAENPRARIAARTLTGSRRKQKSPQGANRAGFGRVFPSLAHRSRYGQSSECWTVTPVCRLSHANRQSQF